MRTKELDYTPAFVEAFVDTVLADLSHITKLMQPYELRRAVSNIKTKLRTVRRGPKVTVTIFVPENDTTYRMVIPADLAGNYAYNPYREAARA